MDQKKRKNKKESEKIEIIFQTPSKINLSSFICPDKTRTRELDNSFKNFYKSFRNENKIKFFSHDFIKIDHKENFNDKYIDKKNKAEVNSSLTSASNYESINGFRDIAKKYSEKIKIDYDENDNHNYVNKENSSFPLISKYNADYSFEVNKKTFNLGEIKNLLKINKNINDKFDYKNDVKNKNNSVNKFK
jgi:hypothetical protein